MRNRRFIRASKDGYSVSDIYKADVDQFVMNGSNICFADKNKQKICRIDCEGKGFSFVDNNCPDYMNVFGRDIYYWYIKDDVWKSNLYATRWCTMEYKQYFRKP